MLKRLNHNFIYILHTCSHRHVIYKKGRCGGGGGGSKVFDKHWNVSRITHTVKLVHLPIMVHVSKMRNSPIPIERMLFYIHCLCFIHVLLPSRPAGSLKWAGNCSAHSSLLRGWIMQQHMIIYGRGWAVHNQCYTAISGWYLQFCWHIESRLYM